MTKFTFGCISLGDEILEIYLKIIAARNPTRILILRD